MRSLRGSMRGWSKPVPVLVGLLLAALLPVLLHAPAAHGQASPCDGTASRPLIPNSYLLPAWSDGAGWSQENQYRTILSGDLDGDGVGELIGRNASQIEIWTWAHNYAAVRPFGTKAYDPVPGQWAQVFPTAGATVQSFPTEDFWWDVARYSTFRLADLDGEPGDELVVRRLGDNHDGLAIYKYNPHIRTWDPPITTDVWGDVDGWNDASTYPTIITGNVDGQPGDEILGRGPNGLETYKFTGTGLTRLDAASPILTAPTWAAPEHNLTMRVADFDMDGQGELAVRGIEGVLRYKLDVASGKWIPLPGVLTEWGNDADPSKGWTTPVQYRTISVGDVNNDGRPDLVGRSTYGISAWYVDAAGGWKSVAPASGFTNADGFNQPEYAFTFQVADVLPAPRWPGSEVIARTSTGVETFALQNGAWVGQPSSDKPFLISQFSNANQWGPFTNPPDTGASNTAQLSADYRYATIKAVTAGKGEPQVVIGRDATGIRTFTATGSTPSAPFPAYTDLKSIGITNLGPLRDLDDLSAESRAFWYINTVAAGEYWPDAGGPTILDQYRNTNLSGTWSGLQTALLSGMASGDQPSGTFDPGNSELQAMNVPRSTYNGVLQDVADWTASVGEVYNHLLGSTGLKSLVEQVFVTNAGQVDTIKQHFLSSSSSALIAFITDLIVGLLGTLASIATLGGASTLTAAVVGLVSSLVGTGVSSGLAFATPNPNGAVNTTADQLKTEIVNNFCSANDFIDQSYDQIVQDYGLLTADRQIIEGTQGLATRLDKVVEGMSRSQELWIWQSFANKKSDTKNFWIGWCDFSKAPFGATCPWKFTDDNTWNPPENTSISYRLIGGNPDCTYSALQPGNDGADLKPLLPPSGLSLISPRINGYPDPDPVTGFTQPIPNNIGIQGWHLGTVKCG